MRLCSWWLWALAVGGASLVHAGDHVLLHAHFDAQTVGVAPGLGGANLGEPIYNASAIVGLAPFTTPNLQVRDTGPNAQYTRFGFLNDEEVVTGTVQVRAQVLFTGVGQPTIGLREQGGAAEQFLTLYTTDNSTSFAALTGGTLHFLGGTVAPNAIVPLEIDASADQQRVSVRIDGVTLLDEAEIDLATARGIGTLLFGVANNTGTVADVMRVDNLRVIACSSPVFADCLFVGGFD
ncbi:MAG TPA: hypothetical protein VFG73_04495 [Rhodanobacteraceae bacterium]|nr:hypothetical protein [Rhodanobacteraceae bacterium]